jgi:ferredoxin, 2Fe-2S
MATVEVRPSGAVFDVQAGETVIQAAWRHGYTWPTVCEGKGSCRACVLQLVEGADALSPIGRWEQEGLDSVTPTLPGDAASYRLACQVTIDDDVVVRKVGVRRTGGAA